MKKIGMILLALFIFSGTKCTSENSKRTTSMKDDMDIELPGNTNTTNAITKSFGSFSLPEDWIEMTEQSRNGKYFYAPKSEQPGSRITNISIEKGTNRYAIEDHMAFRYAIMRQLAMQGGGAITGGGSNTAHNDILYVFTIEDNEALITTTQYYIIGNRKHILVHLTDFHNENITTANEVAQSIVDSFVWEQ
jgi:hypothetical protein